MKEVLRGRLRRFPPTFLKKPGRPDVRLNGDRDIQEKRPLTRFDDRESAPSHGCLRIILIVPSGLSTAPSEDQKG